MRKEMGEGRGDVQMGSTVKSGQEAGNGRINRGRPGTHAIPERRRFSGSGRAAERRERQRDSNFRKSFRGGTKRESIR